MSKPVDYNNPVNWSASLNQGLVAWFIALPLEYLDAELCDIAGGMKATAASGEFLPKEQWGRFAAVACDGTNDKYTIGTTTDLQITGTKTVVMWVKSTSASTFREVFGINELGGSFRGYSLALSGATAGRVGFYHSDSGTYRTATSGTTNDGNWHQIAATVDSGVTNGSGLWLDGIRLDSATINACSFASAVGSIGALPGYRWTPCTIGDIRVYNRCLSAEEMLELYNASHPDRTEQYANELNWIDAPPYYLEPDPPQVYTLTAESGSYTLTGQNAGLYVTRVITADSGSYTLTGQSASLVASRVLTADSGSYTLTGDNAGLYKQFVLAADSGSCALTGQDANLVVSRVLVADSGTYALSGQDAGLVVSRVLPAESGSYSLSGQDANLLANRVLVAESGSYALTGNDAVFSKAYTLTAESGSYTLTGHDAGIYHNRMLAAESGEYQLTGQDAGLIVSRVLTAEGGSYSVTGQDAGLIANRVLVADSGSYSVTGQDATFTITVVQSKYSIIREYKTASTNIRYATAKTRFKRTDKTGRIWQAV